MKPLAVHPNRRRLCHADGSRFDWIGDTAWELLHRCTREEIELYLDKRAAQGFTVVQTVAIPEFNGLTEPNREGLLPLLGQDPATPNPEYFDFARWMIEEAGRRGLYVGFVPTWGAYAVEEEHVLFPNPCVFDPAKARAYGSFLSRHLGDLPNVVWILGGDREPDANLETWRAMAAGLDARSRGQLVTYHPSGGHSSSRLLHGEPWLDFNLFQSGHSDLARPDEMAFADYRRLPIKPVLNGEPCYENIPNDFHRRPGRITDRHVRSALYASLFSGSFGFTYGANEVWMMWRPELEPLSDKVEPPFLGADRTWVEALDLPGASQVRIAFDVLRDLPEVDDRIPMWDRVLGNIDAPMESCYVTGTRSWMLVYTPGRPIRLDTRHLTGQLRTEWIDPRTGERFLGNAAELPSSEDWLLLVQQT